MRSVLFFLIVFFTAPVMYGQFFVQGVVQEQSNKQPLPFASIQLEGTTTGVIADADGKFRLTPTKFPCVLVVNAIGFDKKFVSCSKNTADLVIEMVETPFDRGPVLQIYDDRISQKIKQGALTIETLDLKAIKQSATGNFYESLGALKGVDLTTASLGFRVINTRGFNSTSPVRTLQLIDGETTNLRV